MNKGLASGLVLLILGLVCGLLLAGVNAFTAPTILALENKMKYDSLNSMLVDYQMGTTDDFLISEDKLMGNIDAKFTLSDIATEEMQYVIYSVRARGYQSDIVMLVAVDKDMKVSGYTIVSETETAGIVDYIYTIDFLMVGRLATDVVSIDSVSSVTTAKFSLGAVMQCFQYVAERVPTDFGGGV